MGRCAVGDGADGCSNVAADRLGPARTATTANVAAPTAITSACAASSRRVNPDTALLSRWDPHAVADPANGDDDVRVVQLAAQVRDMHIDHMLVAVLG